jgi:hypothetical protein
MPYFWDGGFWIFKFFYGLFLIELLTPILYILLAINKATKVIGVKMSSCPSKVSNIQHILSRLSVILFGWNLIVYLPKNLQ